MVIAALYIVPFAVVHFVDISKIHLNIPYAPRKITQASLLSKFLSYKEEMRTRINVGEITMAMMRDTYEVCDDGYMKMLQVSGILMKLMLTLIFILAENRLALVPLLLYPLVLGCFLAWRERITIEVNEEKAHRQDKLVQVVNDTVANYRIIADFSLRPHTVDNYERVIDEFHQHQRIATTVVTNSMYMAPWLTTLLIGAWIVYGSFQVDTVNAEVASEGSISLGLFLATINVFKEVGAEMSEIYYSFLEIQKSFGPLEKITHYMNLETDLVDRMRTIRKRVAIGSIRHKDLTTKQPNGFITKLKKIGHREDVEDMAFSVDSVDIEIKNLSFAYQEDYLVLKSVNLSFPQGGIYAFVGPAHHGKGTMMKLLGQVLLPSATQGMIFIPPHLRVLHLAHSECMVNDTFYANVVLYANKRDVNGTKLDRVARVCRRVGLKEDLIKELAGEGKKKHWAQRLSHTDFARLNLARALVMNPECLVIHKPDMVFNANECVNILKLLQAHVDERGIELPEHGRKFRRPRTVFMTCITKQGLEKADRIYEVKRGTEGQIRKTMKVHIKGARELRNSDGILGSSDPYCVCRLSGKKSHYKTETIPQTLNPVWDFACVVRNEEDRGSFRAFEEDVLVFRVSDKDWLDSDDFLGEAKLDVRGIWKAGFKGELPLMLPSANAEGEGQGQTEQAGFIEITVTWTGKEELCCSSQITELDQQEALQKY